MRSFGRVMIVDDSSTSRMIIQRCMEMAGIEVGVYLWAENGLDAMAKLRSGVSVDLIVTDINMPKMDGRTFAGVLKGEERGMKAGIIVVSSVADSALEAELRALGVSAVVKKPVSPAKMLDAVGGIP